MSINKIRFRDEKTNIVIEHSSPVKKLSKNITPILDSSINKLWMILAFTAFSIVTSLTVYFMIIVNTKEINNNIVDVNNQIVKSNSEIKKSLVNQNYQLSNNIKMMDSLNSISKNVILNLKNTNKNSVVIEKINTNIKSIISK